jgi:tRNA (guanine-N7-)-methyltransferase
MPDAPTPPPPANESTGAAPAAERPATPKPRPYAHAPRLPLEGPIDLRTVVQGAWLEVEVGPGRGRFLLERAVAAPEAAVVGLEIRRQWATIVDERLEKRGLHPRARCFAEDAREVLPRLVNAGQVKRVFLHFPDPWWKKRHEKRLVMGELFLREVARLLEPGGELYIQTDVPFRADQYAGAGLGHDAFEPAGDEPGSAILERNPYGARSDREARADVDGLPVTRMRFRKK